MKSHYLEKIFYTQQPYRRLKIIVILLFLILFAIIWALTQGAKAESDTANTTATKEKNSCVECHTQMGEALAHPVEAMQKDVHAEHNLSCADCHGGDPTQFAPELAMNPRKGFIAKPKPKEMAAFCGKCHSDAEFMKKFNPTMRVDQEHEYATSVHGKRVQQGDEKPATCISCHGFHGIKAVNDATSPVYPLNVAATCSGCHANADYMRGYDIPTNQLEKYNHSVHAEALQKKQDLSAPTCNDCHGNHGAAPPGVSAVANVCGTCHSRQAEMFQKSPHNDAFANMGVAGCAVCHSNHEIQTPSDELIGTNDKSACVNCHTQGDAGFAAAATMRGMISELDEQIHDADGLLTKAAKAGMEVSRPQFELQETRNQLVNARVVVHSFSPTTLANAVSPAIESAKKQTEEGKQALVELRNRYKGLGLSLAFIFLAAMSVYLKIRQIENGKNK
ncbi:MAG: cytochrome c3 family protein [Acidobacteriota bacterium]